MPVRAESHGCMRVQNPDQLAAVLLKQDQGWSQARTMSAIETGYDQHIALRQKIPVYITYFTLKVNDDGSHLNLRGHLRPRCPHGGRSEAVSLGDIGNLGKSC